MDITAAEIQSQIRDLENQLAIARQKEANKARDERRAQIIQTVKNLNSADLLADNPKYQGVADYILPLGRDYGKIRLSDPETYPFGKDWLAGDTAYIVQRMDVDRKHPSRVVMGSGRPMENWKIGNEWTFRHDQTNGYLGEYRVVGVVVFDADGNIAKQAGNVPTRKLSGAVFK